MPYVDLMSAASNQLNSMRKSFNYIHKADLWDPPLLRGSH